MGFRDETQALRARIEALEGELDSARDELAELEADRLEIGKLRARIAELEAELGKYGPQPKWWTKITIGKPQRRALGGLIAFGLCSVIFYIAMPTRPDLDAPPERGVLELDTIPRPAPISASVTGQYDVSQAAEACRGFVGSQPIATLRTQTARHVRLWTDSNADLVLFVRDSSGRVFCDDDTGEGMNPRLSLDLPSGDHDVWVGTYAEDSHAAFTLRIDGQTQDESGLVVNGEVSLEVVRVSGVDRHEVSGAAAGHVRADLAREACLGFVPNRPQVELDVREPGVAQIVARSSEDLVLLVRRPDGSFICDDDSAGDLDPRLVEDLQVGHYLVWIGTYAEGRSTRFELAIDVDGLLGPRTQGRPRLGHWDLGAEAVLSFTERVDGRTAISSTQPECRTLFGAPGPDVELRLSQARTVTLSLTSEARLGLLIEHPDGTQTCDTSMGSQPVVWAAGTHRVWIGASTLGASTPFTLMAQTQPP